MGKVNEKQINIVVTLVAQYTQARTIKKLLKYVLVLLNYQV